MLLVFATVFALRLTMAEIHFSRGLRAGAASAAFLPELAQARGLYPFDRRFREPSINWVMKKVKR